MSKLGLAAMLKVLAAPAWAVGLGDDRGDFEVWLREEVRQGRNRELWRAAEE